MRMQKFNFHYVESVLRRMKIWFHCFYDSWYRPILGFRCDVTLCTLIGRRVGVRNLDLKHLTLMLITIVIVLRLDKVLWTLWIAWWNIIIVWFKRTMCQAPIMMCFSYFSWFLICVSKLRLGGEIVWFSL